MKEDLRVSVIQMEARCGETECNLRRIAFFAAQARHRGAALACFPECALTGYSPKNAGALALPADGKECRYLEGLARLHAITLLVGMIERGRGKPYLTQMVFGPRGLIGRYRKTHLGAREREYFAPGDVGPVFHTPKADIGVELCWDAHFPGLSFALSRKGAEILFVPHAAPQRAGARETIWNRYLPARAYDNRVYLCACNLCGENGQGTQFGGGLLIAGPDGEIMAQRYSPTAGMLTATLPADRLNRYRADGDGEMESRCFPAFARVELYD